MGAGWRGIFAASELSGLKLPPQEVPTMTGRRSRSTRFFWMHRKIREHLNHAAFSLGLWAVRDRNRRLLWIAQLVTVARLQGHGRSLGAFGHVIDLRFERNYA